MSGRVRWVDSYVRLHRFLTPDSLAWYSCPRLGGYERPWADCPPALVHLVEATWREAEALAERAPVWRSKPRLHLWRAAAVLVLPPPYPSSLHELQTFVRAIPEGLQGALAWPVEDIVGTYYAAELDGEAFESYRLFLLLLCFLEQFNPEDASVSMRLACVISPSGLAVEGAEELPLSLLPF